MWSTINKNSSCKSRMCSKILDFAAFWNQENTKLSNCKSTFSFSPWQVSWGDADTNERGSARCAPSYQRAQTKWQEKKRCVSANTHNSLLSYSQSTRFPHHNPLRGKRERPCARRFAGFQARSSTKSLSSPVRNFRATFQTNFDLSVLFLSGFLLFQHQAPVSVKMVSAQCSN